MAKPLGEARGLEMYKDEELIERIRAGDGKAQDELLTRYKDVMKRKARSYFMIGADKDDLLQEGMIGLYKAICDYRDDRGASFRTFAELCIERQLISAIKSAGRLKHRPLNDYISLQQPQDGAEYEQTLLDILMDEKQEDPVQALIDQEQGEGLLVLLRRELSDFEWEVVTLYARGYDYKQIAVSMDKSPKSIDNALQRIKKKAQSIRSRADGEL